MWWVSRDVFWPEIHMFYNVRLRGGERQQTHMKVLSSDPTMTDVAGDGQERENALCFSLLIPAAASSCLL